MKKIALSTIGIFALLGFVGCSQQPQVVKKSEVQVKHKIEKRLDIDIPTYLVERKAEYEKIMTNGLKIVDLDKYYKESLPYLIDKYFINGDKPHGMSIESVINVYTYKDTAYIIPNASIGNFLKISDSEIMNLIDNKLTTVEDNLVKSSLVSFKITSFKIGDNVYKLQSLQQDVITYPMSNFEKNNYMIDFNLETKLPTNINADFDDVLAVKGAVAFFTLGGSLILNDDKKYWQKRVKELNGKLALSYMIHTNKYGKVVHIPDNTPSYCFKGHEDKYYDSQLEITNRQAYQAKQINLSSCSVLPKELKANYSYSGAL